VTITTVGACAATRADWDITVAEGSGDALVFILPYEFREECALSPDRVLRLNPFTHTEVVDLQWAREVLIRVVDATAEPVDINLEVPSR
jgi:hypothetical protein